MIHIIDNYRTKLSPIPTGWTHTRMKSAVKRYQNKKNKDDNPTVLSLTKTGVKIKTNLSFGRSAENYVGHQLVEKGQFVFTPRDLDIPSILCGISKYDGCISNLYIVFDVAKHLLPQYLEYYFYGLQYGFSYFEKLSFGMRYSFNQKQFEHIPLIYPDYKKQKEIADFLDRETARIDQLIEKKNNFLNILNEKLQSKADEVDGLYAGKTNRLRHLIRLNPGKIEAQHLPEDHKVTFLPMEAIDNGFGGINDLAQIRQLREVKGSYTYFTEGDILLAKVTPCFENGKKAHAINLKNGIGFGTSELHVLKIFHSIIPDYLNLILSTSRFRAEGCTSMTGTGGLKRVSERAILDFKIQLPSEREQKIIVDRIINQIAPVKKISQRTNLSVKKLQNLKSSLITEAVTGQLDIQKWRRRGMTDRRLDKIEADMKI